MFPAWLAGVLAAAAAETARPSPEGRALYTVADPAYDGNGPGGGVFVEARDLGAREASLGGVAVAGWTFRPLRLAIAFPGEARTDHVDGLPPRLDLAFVLSDRKKGGLGVAGGLDTPLPFVEGGDRTTWGRLALGVGRADTAFAVNLAVPVGRDLTSFRWAVGLGVPVFGPLTGFAEIDGGAPIRGTLRALPFLPDLDLPVLDALRLGLHLTPVRPLVLTLAVSGHPSDPGPTLSVGALWTPSAGPRRPSTEGPDLDGDRVGDAVDACPGEKEDLDGGNDADGCPDGGANGPRDDDGAR